MSDRLLILRGDEISDLLRGRELEMIEEVRKAYVAHHWGRSSLPLSSFLRFPGDDTNRIIALPAFLGGELGVAGLKWISSFPGNVRKGKARASAVLLLNSCEDGHVEAILESSLISAKRTAASAALAAQRLSGDNPTDTVGLIGTGVINLEVAHFLRAALPAISRVVLFDLDPERAARFGERLSGIGFTDVEVVPSRESVLAGCSLVSFATTAIRPYVDDLSLCPPGATILHISLRDLTPEAILTCDNITDDTDHVCRAQTSLHLTEERMGTRDFIRCTLAEICEGLAPPRAEDKAITVFSPFGLGILDLAVGKLALEAARAAGRGTIVESFLPTEEGLV
ncbi:MAG TPA: 2,3-diaminopropionate biosynthesis protein SbnB [Thermoanaerobaculia bacterium]|nr:2,3-diaminopropionate biosynthesis protein SbnB [Thermoanaerobaculia bacterium]